MNIIDKRRKNAIINSKFPNLMATSSLTVIIMELIRRKREKKLNKNRGKQLVLTNNRNNQVA